MISAVSGSQLAPVELAHNVPASRTPRFNSERDEKTGHEKMLQGWIKLHRTLTENPLWKDEKFSRGQAWVDLLLNTNHAHGYFRTANGRRVDVGRGQCGMSQLTMSKRWQWSRGKVKRFLSELEKDQNIIQQTVQQNSLLTICNYSKYQTSEIGASTIHGTISETVSEQQTVNKRDSKRDTNKNEENDNNGKNEKKLPVEVDNPLFNTFWKIYPGPRKRDKPKAKTLFNKESKATQELIVNHIKHRSLNDPQWLKNSGDFIPGPVPFLNQHGWTDEYRATGSESRFTDLTQKNINTVMGIKL
jgi:hypothetical protein